MSNPFQNHSDSDDDGDYVPPAEAESNSESGDEAESKRPRIESERDVEEERKNRDALWASFQASVASSSNQRLEEQPKKKMVKIEKKYLFAGDYITEVIEVPEDSPDAKKWPLYDEDTLEESSVTPAVNGSTLPKTSLEENVAPATVLTTTTTTTTTTSDALASSSKSDTPTKPVTKKLGPRKPKTVLQALPSSSSQKAKKLTTLDKSLMDWKAHTQDSALQDELEANRRGGGYLEKLEFLKRVDERKEENLEAMKGRKRKKTVG